MNERNLQKLSELTYNVEGKSVLHVHVTGNGRLRAADLEKYQLVANLYSEVHIHVTEDTKVSTFVRELTSEIVPA